MELRHLRYFVAVAEELHFSRAAERVGIAQPPFSQQIRALEDEIGARLLLRTKRTVKLTAAGQAFLVEARKTLALSEQALQTARRAARGEVGKLAVGFVSSAVYGKFAGVFGRMRDRFPDVALTLQELTSEQQVKAVTASQIDVGLLRPPVMAGDSLALRAIETEPLVAALPSEHPLAQETTISLQAMAGESFLLVPRQLGPGFYDQVIGYCARAGFAPRVVQEASTAQTIVSLIAGGMGVSVVPASLQSLRRDGVVYRPFKDPTLVTDLAVLWRQQDASGVLTAFLEIIWETAGFNNGARK
jgi:DNA-binding transcriptional LysR family regulator